MMQRRDFLVWGSLIGISPYIEAKVLRTFEKEFKEVEKTIFSVQKHMFPENSILPSARRMRSNEFLFDTIKHKCFDKDIRVFVLEGAREFQQREKGLFLTMNEEGKEKALRSYEQTSYGSAWLARIMTLSMEGLFSDPIYGSNKNEAGWKALETYGGYPRAKTRYLGVDHV